MDKRKIKIPYKVHPGFKKFHSDIKNLKIRYILTKSGIGGGKTWAGANAIIKWLIEHPGHYALIVGPDYNILKVAIRTVIHFLPKELIKDWRKTDREVWLWNGSWMEFKSCTDPNSLRGVGPDIIWGDEASYFSEEAWQVLFTRGNRTKKTKFILTTTPRGKNWLFQQIITPWQEGNEEYSVHTCRTIDNPATDPIVVEEARKKLPDKFFRQEYLGTIEDWAGLVYFEFNKLKHVLQPHQIPTIEKDWPMIVGMDWGIGEGATCALWAARNPKTNVIYIFNEYYYPGGVISEHARNIRIRTTEIGKLPLYYVIDPSAAKHKDGETGKTIWQLYYDRKLITILGDNQFPPGVQEVNELFKADKLFISSKCSNLISEIPGYNHKDNDPTKTTGVDHACHTLRYIVRAFNGFLSDYMPENRGTLDEEYQGKDGWVWKSIRKKQKKALEGENDFFE